MALEQLLESLRESVSDRVWSAAVALARSGAVVGRSSSDDELVLAVAVRGRPEPHEVFLWPADLDHGCDCDLPQPCVHICAAAIAVQQGVKQGRKLPKPAKRYQVSLRYDFTREGARLALRRVVVWPDGREETLRGSLADASYLAGRGDTQADALLASHRAGPLSEERLRRLLVFLEGDAPATLDGGPVRMSNAPISFVVKVKDEGAEAFRVGLYRPAGLDALFVGAALRDGVLHPTSYGNLPEDERRALHPSRHDRVFAQDKVGWLVSEYLPRLRSLGVPVEIETQRLPQEDALSPRARVRISEAAEGLRLECDLVYGDPPVAIVQGSGMVKVGPVVPVRDMPAEARVRRELTEKLRMVPGSPRLVPPADAAAFLRDVVPKLPFEVVGEVNVERFRVTKSALQPTINVRPVHAGDASHSLVHGDAGTAAVAQGPALEGWQVDVRFGGPDGAADAQSVLRAWRTGRPVVPLMGGGYAPLPLDWLREHGALLAEVLDARDAQGRVSRNATVAVAELLEDVEGEVPPDLERLRDFLGQTGELPEEDPPEGFVAELRPYQLTGFRWLRFLQQMDLHGVLADDMGLGKTVQTLAALAATPGPHLVVAPTSVLENWSREAERFAPGRSVNIYHGPGRSLDRGAWLTLTSYALLRLDLPALRAVPWSWCVLDEAQAIKNADSQTSRAACRVPGKHRLALSGTPVENRLEELWSLFRFLMPGLLGSLDSFKQRFVRPIEAGDAQAGLTLRSRVRPYILRRVKRDVALDLPPVTSIVERCELGTVQRRVYDAVRAAARDEVASLLQETGRVGALQILEALLRMRQACCDPHLLPGRAPADAGSAKLDRLEELLVELVPEGHKVLVFSQFTSFLDRVEPRLRGLDIPWVRLDGGTRDRQAVVDRFQSDDGPPVFLLSLKAGGTGLNLTAADYVVLLDPWWNPAVEQQATDRAHRIGQDKPVVNVRLVAAETIEERILELQEHKRQLAATALGDEAVFVDGLSADELRALFDAA